MQMQFTCDPTVYIEEEYPGYVRYYASVSGKRWEVFGTCDRRGDCLIGAVVEGFGRIESHADIEEAKRTLRLNRLISELDVPITPKFKGCCPFTYNEL